MWANIWEINGRKWKDYGAKRKKSCRDKLGHACPSISEGRGWKLCSHLSEGSVRLYANKHSNPILLSHSPSPLWWFHFLESLLKGRRHCSGQCNFWPNQSYIFYHPSIHLHVMDLFECFRCDSLVVELSQKWHLVSSLGGFPDGAVVKNLPANAGDVGLIPGLGRLPWRRKWQPTPVLLPGKLYGPRSLVGYSPWGHKSLSRLSMYTHT